MYFLRNFYGHNCDGENVMRLPANPRLYGTKWHPLPHSPVPISPPQYQHPPEQLQYLCPSPHPSTYTLSHPSTYNPHTPVPVGARRAGAQRPGEVRLETPAKLRIHISPKQRVAGMRRQAAETRSTWSRTVAVPYMT